MLETIVLSAAAFAGTNIDDLFISMFFFSSACSAAQKRRIAAGKYLGLLTLSILSFLGAKGVQALPLHWIRLLGLVPAALGIREAIRAVRRSKDDETQNVPGPNLLLSTALVTIANGADNIGIYVPLFASFTMKQMAAAAVVFLLLNGLWCWIADKLVSLPLLRTALDQGKAFIVPLVYLLLGLYILF